MFCTKCGAKNDDDAVFCLECGAKFGGGQAARSSAPAAASPNDKNRKVGMIAVGVAVVIVIGLVIALFGGRSYKATVKKYVNASFEPDAKAIMKLFPKKMLDYAMEEEGYDDDDLDALIDEGNDALQSQIDYIEEYLGKDWKLSYEIVSTENIKGRELKELKDGYKDMDIKVSAAKSVEVEFTVKAGETENSNSMNISLIKVGRSWYLDLRTMGNIF